MPETIVKPEVVRPVPAEEAGIHGKGVVWTANLAEKAVAIPLGMGRVARGEMFRAAYAGVDWLESVNQAQFKVLRELVHRVDLLTLEVVEALESVATAGTGVVRDAGHAAGEMVSRTAAALTPKKHAPTTPA